MGQYTQQLIRHLPLADPDDEYVAWYLHARGLLRPRRFFADVRARNLTEKASRFPARIFQPASYRLGVPRVEWLIDFDLFVATNFLAPATNHPDRVVPIVHDLAFRHFPESAPHIDERWRRRFAATLAVAPAIVVPSAATARDLLEAFAVDEARVHVVHHGVEAEAFAPVSQAGIDTVRRRHGIPGGYVLFVGGIEPRKNLELLVRAFAESDAQDLALVIAGGPVRWFPEATERLDAVDRAAPSEREGADRAHRLRERSRQARAPLRCDGPRVSVALRGVRVPGARGVRRRRARPDVERVLAARGGRRGRGAGGSRGRPRDREGAVGAGRATRTCERSCPPRAWLERPDSPGRQRLARPPPSCARPPR